MTESHQNRTSVAKLVLFVIAMAIFFSHAVTISQHGPFFPTAAAEKGSSEILVGMITGVNSVAGIICLLLLQIFVGSAYCQEIFILGTLFAGIANFCFAFTIIIENQWIFSFTCLIIRAAIGVAGSFVWCNGMVIFIGMYSSQPAMTTGIIQASYGSGVILGPATGSLLFRFGGFKLPFIVSGSLQVVLAILFCCFMQLSSSECEKEESESIGLMSKTPNFVNEASSNVTSVKDLFNFATNWGTIIGNSAYFLNCASLGYLDVALGPHLLKSFSMDGDTSGYIFLFYSVAYCLSTVVAGKVTDYGYGAFVLLMSSGVASIAYALLFLPIIVTKLEHIAWDIPLLILCGAGLGMSAVPVFTITERAAPLCGFSGTDAVKKIMFTWCNVNAFGGFLFGSVLIGGFALEFIGYHWTNLATAVLFALCNFATLASLAKLDMLRKLK